MKFRAGGCQRKVASHPARLAAFLAGRDDRGLPPVGPLAEAKAGLPDRDPVPPPSSIARFKVQAAVGRGPAGLAVSAYRASSDAFWKRRRPRAGGRQPASATVGRVN
jgi:hypothetical protein